MGGHRVVVMALDRPHVAGVGGYRGAPARNLPTRIRAWLGSGARVVVYLYPKLKSPLP